MNRFELIQDTREILSKTGFYISDHNDSRLICFDIVARRDNLLIILKMLMNVDSFTKDNSHALSLLSNMLNGVPILVGEHTSQKKLENGIVYFRHGVPLVNFSTLQDLFIEGVSPLIFSAPGGLYVNIDGETLRRAREMRSISLGTLAKIAGVSRKAIQMYEGGMSTILDVALRLEDYLDIELVQPMNLFEFDNASEQPQIEFYDKASMEHSIFSQLEALGYKVVPTTHCPFDAITKDNKALIITGVSKKNKKTLEKARTMAKISRITEHYSVIFLEKSIRRDNLEGTPIIHTEELQKVEDSDEIITLISERI